MFDAFFKWVNTKVPGDALTKLVSGKITVDTAKKAALDSASNASPKILSTNDLKGEAKTILVDFFQKLTAK